MSTQPSPFLKSSEVFVPGGLPKYTYVSRDARGLETRLANATDNAHKLVVVTGATKSGKTVLVRTVLKKTSLNDKPRIWLEGARIRSLDGFFQLLGDPLAVIAESTSTITIDHSHETADGTSVGGSAHVIKVDKESQKKDVDEREISTENKQIVSIESQVAAALLAKLPVIIIDDFHYIRRELQGEITRFLKALIFEGLNVIYIAIPQRRYDAVKVEGEMSGRIAHVVVPHWSVTELLEISEKGFPLLNVRPNLAVSRHLGYHANGSPHLMQEFCREICNREGFNATCEKTDAINPVISYENIFKTVAKEYGQHIVDKLSHCVMEDRRKHYVAVLLALSTLDPSTVTVTLYELRKRLRESFPNLNLTERGVVSILQHIAVLSSAEDSSVTALDYEEDEKKLHIIDPFFSFFLKWGKELLPE